jgi:HD-GYP domain-containing protein (c-di-GMP phosphodiesterase class II)
VVGRKGPRRCAAPGSGEPGVRLVRTASSDPPPEDSTEQRWRSRPQWARLVRAIVVLTPLAVSIAAGVAASRVFRPTDALSLCEWLLWTAAVSLGVLAIVDALVRRLLPLQRLLQLCLVFPDRAPSRLKLAVQAARPRRPEALLNEARGPETALEAAVRVVRLLAALSVHDRRTRGHSERVCAFTELLAKEMGLSQADRDRLMWVALVHDVGKLDVPSRLLNKPGRPTVTEWHVLQEHPARGAAIIAPLRSWLGSWADAVEQHHERYDGTGYPHRLSGSEIGLGARIVAVADAFEVMTAPRPYRRSVDAQAARAELARHAGTQFDPDVVRHFLAVGLPVLRRSMGLLAWLGQLPFLRDWPRLASSTSATAAQAMTSTAVASTAGLFAFGASTLPASAASGDHMPAVPPVITTTTPAVAVPARDMPDRGHVAVDTTSARPTVGSPVPTEGRLSSSDASRVCAETPAAPKTSSGSGSTTTTQSSAGSHGRHVGWTRARERRSENGNEHGQGPKPH